MLAVIGGSGVYAIEGLNNARWIKAESSFGSPSDEFLMGELGGETVVFLPRHGRGHRIPPTQINYRANIDALKRHAVPRLAKDRGAGVCACRSVLDHALITAPEARDPQLAQRLSAVAGRVLKHSA